MKLLNASGSFGPYRRGFGTPCGARQAGTAGANGASTGGFSLHGLGEIVSAFAQPVITLEPDEHASTPPKGGSSTANAVIGGG